MNRDTAVFYVAVTPKGKKGEPSERIDLADRLLNFAFTDDEKKADVLEISLDNHDLSQFDSPLWKYGQVLKFSWGYPGHITPEREGVIQEVTGHNPLKIKAHAKSVLMDTELLSNTWENTTRSAVVEEIALIHGYYGERAHIQDTQIILPTITQARLSDAQFLRHLANKEGFEFFIDYDGLHWHERNLDQAPAKTFVYYSDPGQGEILSWNVDGSIVKKPSSVKARGRDPLSKETIEGKASNSDTSRTTLGAVVENIDQQTGASLGDSSVNTAHDETLPTTETSSEGAARVAEGRYKRGQINNIKLNVDMIGDPNIAAKMVIEIQGISQRLSGYYYISSVKHTIQNGNYAMKLQVKRDSSSRVTGLRGAAGVPAGGNQNRKAPTASDKLTPVTMVDQKTGRQTTIYVDKRAREGVPK